MRIFTWFGGLVIVAALVSTAGALAVAHQRAASAHVLAAAHQPFAAVNDEPTFDPPRRPLKPSPSPSPDAAPAAPASQPSGPALIVDSTQQALINQDRARYGLPPLTWSSCLYSVARGQAAYLASGVAFQHYGGVQQDLGCHLGPQVGENIGWWSLGINDSQLNTMFMNSAEHRANILGPYHYVATAWAVRSDGRAYIAVEFG